MNGRREPVSRRRDAVDGAVVGVGDPDDAVLALHLVGVACRPAIGCADRLVGLGVEPGQRVARASWRPRPCLPSTAMPSGPLPAGMVLTTAAGRRCPGRRRSAAGLVAAPVAIAGEDAGRREPADDGDDQRAAKAIGHALRRARAVGRARRGAAAARRARSAAAGRAAARSPGASAVGGGVAAVTSGCARRRRGRRSGRQLVAAAARAGGQAALGLRRVGAADSAARAARPRSPGGRVALVGLLGERPRDHRVEGRAACPGPSRPTLGGGSCSCAYIFATSVSRSYGGRPVSAWNSRQPSA